MYQKKVMRVISIAIFLLFTGVHSQQDPLISQYVYNTYALNPAFFGTLGVWEGVISARKQWGDFPGSPAILMVSLYHTAFLKRYTGGILALVDRIGPVRYSFISASMGYVLKAGRNASISAGMRAGIAFWNFDTRNIKQKDMEDLNTLTNNQYGGVLPFLSVGILYQSGKFYGGASITNLTESVASTSPIYGEYLQKRHFYLFSGYTVVAGSGLLWKPSFCLRFVRGTPLNFQLDNTFVISQILIAGLGLRSSPALIFILGATLKDNIRAIINIERIVSRDQRNGLMSYELIIGTSVFTRKIMASPSVL